MFCVLLFSCFVCYRPNITHWSTRRKTPIYLLTFFVVVVVVVVSFFFFFFFFGGGGGGEHIMRKKLPKTCLKKPDKTSLDIKKSLPCLFVFFPRREGGRGERFERHTFYIEIYSLQCITTHYGGLLKP